MASLLRRRKVGRANRPTIQTQNSNEPLDPELTRKLASFEQTITRIKAVQEAVCSYTAQMEALCSSGSAVADSLLLLFVATGGSNLQSAAMEFRKVQASIQCGFKLAVERIMSERVVLPISNLLNSHPQILEHIDQRKQAEREFQGARAALQAEAVRPDARDRALQSRGRRLAQAHAALARLTDDIKYSFQLFEDDQTMLMSEFSALVACQTVFFQTAYEKTLAMAPQLPASATTSCLLSVHLTAAAAASESFEDGRSYTPTGQNTKDNGAGSQVGRREHPPCLPPRTASGGAGSPSPPRHRSAPPTPGATTPDRPPEEVAAAAAAAPLPPRRRPSLPTAGTGGPPRAVRQAATVSGLGVAPGSPGGATAAVVGAGGAGRARGPPSRSLSSSVRGDEPDPDDAAAAWEEEGRPPAGHGGGNGAPLRSGTPLLRAASARGKAKGAVEQAPPSRGSSAWSGPVLLQEDGSAAEERRAGTPAFVDGGGGGSRERGQERCDSFHGDSAGGVVSPSSTQPFGNREEIFYTTRTEFFNDSRSGSSRSGGNGDDGHSVSSNNNHFDLAIN